MRKFSATIPITVGLLGLVILILAYNWTRSVHAMSVSFNVKDLEELRIIGPHDPSFDGLLSTYFKESSREGFEDLKPFSVFVKNTSSRSVVAYVLRWELARRDGRVITNFSAYAQPGILLGSPIAASYPSGSSLSSDRIRCDSSPGTHH